ncbi:hypothetical protein RRG08_039465 [Elysia crispata]|uniref:Uncharacterized protein n=1 Tax=Elysia crispata TaxID=231223 RepID=A0AAE0YKT6_9GAST|nr:hypothetical protein RRG08_039465 [Elysia crispata]
MTFLAPMISLKLSRQVRYLIDRHAPVCSNSAGRGQIALSTLVLERKSLTTPGRKGWVLAPYRKLTGPYWEEHTQWVIFTWFRGAVRSLTDLWSASGKPQGPRLDWSDGRRSTGQAGWTPLTSGPGQSVNTMSGLRAESSMASTGFGFVEHHPGWWWETRAVGRGGWVSNPPSGAPGHALSNLALERECRTGSRTDFGQSLWFLVRQLEFW